MRSNTKKREISQPHTKEFITDENEERLYLTTAKQRITDGPLLRTYLTTTSEAQ